MFGKSVSEEVSFSFSKLEAAIEKSQISMDLLNTPGYNTALNQVALWMLVISPLWVALSLYNP